MEPKQHWDKVYRTKQPTEVSWYRPHLELSLRLIEDAAPERGAVIVDVGAGESTLVDDLLARGYQHLIALDISPTALDAVKERMGSRAADVTWICGDVRAVSLGLHTIDVWHDRAVFHFLTEPSDRSAYVQHVAHAVKPGGHVIVATFGPEGPIKCSGLDVVRYAPETLHGEFGPSFRLVDHHTELHETPMGSTQQFTYCYCRIAGDSM